MVRIILNNQIQDSPYKKATLDLRLGRCFINDEEELDISHFKKLDFSHPLLSEPILPKVGDEYCFIYNNLNSLLKAPRFVYATLLHSKKPINYRFKIAPSDPIPSFKGHYKIPLSLDSSHSAKDLIDINQLNKIVSAGAQSNHPFSFQDSYQMDQQFSFNDLPDEINADDLYTADSTILNLLLQPDDVTKYELRYINQRMGYGVYAQQDIKKEDAVLMYYGMKQIHPSDASLYYFDQLKDCFNMGIEAQANGGLARFINHASLPDETNTNNTVLDANLIAKRHHIYGMEVIVYSALRDIIKNEQLLVSYGTSYFITASPLSFSSNGTLLGPDNRIVKDSASQKAYTLKILAQSGISRALIPLYTRAIVTLILFGLFCYYLN